jgi:hypothetical protein
LKATIKFCVALIALTIINTAIWQELVDGRLYDCTDAFGFDYWQPGDWIHNPVSVVGLSVIAP